MFRRFVLWISHFWGLLCEFIMPSAPITQTPSTSVSNALALSTTSQASSSSPSDLMPSTTIPQNPFSTVSCALASTSSQTSRAVFLSFRGVDTRTTFTSHLYNRLVGSGFSTFMDDPELRSGQVISDALFQAIQESKIYVVVFSENYASSAWCLKELVEILNCYKTMQRLVIPVFYNIDPSVVRYQTDKFKEAFEIHRTRSPQENVKKWRDILREVSLFSGYHITRNGRSEADIISEIINRILLDMNPNTLDVTKYPVGLDSRVKDIMSLMSAGSKGVINIGIYGMGGMGKTTLAKALFNQLLLGGRFNGSCFLANVRDASGNYKGIESLQQKLINEVLKSNKTVEVHSVAEGTKLIRERLCLAKVLVLVDDIYDRSHYEYLVGPFASGSVVIITTRDEEMLDKIQVEPRYRYKVPELNNKESLSLFTKHAFESGKQDNTLMALSEDILRLAGGLPLALEVFGAYLSTQPSVVGWKAYIEKLQRDPDSNIQQKLIISVNAIELEDRLLKEIFLDIACVFIGMDKRNVVKILETFYLYADHKIDILKKRCLLTINKSEFGIHLEMHDLLRDVGREIARKDSANEPENYSRLWAVKDVYDVLENQSGTKAIECIIYTDGGNELNGVTFTTKTFKRMSKLRFLNLIKVNLTGSFEHIFKDLRWLRWDSCPLKCLPSDFCPQKLEILELPRSNMRTMWELNMVSRVFGNLKILNMSYSENLSTITDFTSVPYLETLNLQGCASLEEVHMSIGSLVRLVSLDLYGCVKIRSLPDSICNLRALQVLTVSQCRSLEAFPIQLGSITSLIELNASGLTVSKLPDSIGSLTELFKLDLRDNKNLETLPDTICNLITLRILNIGSCSSLKALPTAIGNIESLKEINVRQLTVPRLPDSIGRLTKLVELDLSFNKELETLPDTICNLRFLETLKIIGCKKLEILPDQLWNLTRLKELDASDAKLLKKLPDIGSSKIALSLQKLKLSGITALPSGFCQLSNLQSLDLRCCFDLLSIPELPNNLKCIRASYCKSLERLANLSNLKQLEELDLDNCECLTEVKDLEELTALRYLSLIGCSGLTLIRGLDQLTSIRTLRLESDSRLTYKRLTKRLFQIYSEFGHQIRVQAGKFRKIDRQDCPDWIIESPYWTSASSKSQSVFAHLLPGESQNFLGIILCFQCGRYDLGSDYSVKNTTSGFVWSDKLDDLDSSESLMVIVPKSIFPITDDDNTIELTVEKNVKIVGIHLLYKTETKTIEDVVEKHVIDIDTLKSVNPVLQDIFLDIACFFIQWKKERVVQILKTYYSDVDLAIDILVKRCLLKINERDRLEMNDLLRHIAKKIASNNSPDEPGKRSRLWLSIDVYEVFKNHKGTEVIEGIVPYKKPFFSHNDALRGESFTLETFQKMRKLRFLYLKMVHFTGSFEQTFEDLRWLCWEDCPLKCLPFNFYPPKLVILELRRSNITTWELNMVPHVFENLKTLDMALSKDLITTPDFTKLPCLETLILSRCFSLEEVNMSIGSLVRLVSLDLSGCVKLKSLPDTICNLRALKFLSIGQCSNLVALPGEFGDIESLSKINAEGLTVSELPNSIGRLSKLLMLRVSSNKNIETLPDTICNLRSLEILDISDCSCLKALPLALGKLQSLRILKAKNLTVPKLPDSIGQLSKLVELRLFGNENLETLPVTICNLRSMEILDIYGCEKLEILPDQLCNFTSLRELIAGGATLLKSFPYQSAFSLQKFDFSGSLLTAMPSGISQLSNLKELNLKYCRRLLSIAELPCNLKWIRADGCRSMESLPNLSNLKQLEYFNLEDCNGLTEIQGLEGLTSIKRLHLEGCNSSLLAYIFTESFFQIYSEFGNPIQISSTEFPVWIRITQSSLSGWSMCLDLPVNVSCHFLGMILCFKPWYYSTNYSLKNTTSDFIWRDSVDCSKNKSLMVIVPRSIFSVKDGDDRIELTTELGHTHAIHLLYKTEEHDNTTANED